MSARRRGTGLTLRAGSNSRSEVPPMTRDSISASCRRLVSVPLATLKTSSVTSAFAARTLARATSSM